MAAHLAGLTLSAFIGHSVGVRTTDDYSLDKDPRRRNINLDNAFCFILIVDGCMSSTGGIVIHTPSIAGVTVCQRAGVWPACVAYSSRLTALIIASRRYRLPLTGIGICQLT